MRISAKKEMINVATVLIAFPCFRRYKKQECALSDADIVSVPCDVATSYPCTLVRIWQLPVVHTVQRERL